MSASTDVFSVDEIARAAGVPREAVESLIATGTVRPLAGTSFFATEDAVRAGRDARRALHTQTSIPGTSRGIFTSPGDRPPLGDRRRGLPSVASSVVHAVFALGMLALTAGSTQSASPPSANTRLVFLARPGPGGGGGGGGLKNPLPAPSVETRGIHRRLQPVTSTSPEKILVSARRIDIPRPTPKPTPSPALVVPDPLPARTLIAPVATVASNRQREGVLERDRRETDSLGTGSDGGTGAGRGLGDGEGVGSGIGAGSGGGTGGGPYRAGSGIEPPRLIREIKAQYTDDARRRGTTGAVVLEIVVSRDGTVGDVSVLRGLGAGLDQRAIDAVRQWKFAPARRRGEAVDVIVEVSVEFTLR